MKPRRKNLPPCRRAVVQPSIPLRTRTLSKRVSGLEMSAPRRASTSKPDSRFEPLFTERILGSPRTCLAEVSVSQARRSMSWGLRSRLPSRTRREGLTSSFLLALPGREACRTSEPRSTELLTRAVSGRRPGKRVEVLRSPVSPRATVRTRGLNSGSSRRIGILHPSSGHGKGSCAPSGFHMSSRGGFLLGG